MPCPCLKYIDRSGVGSNSFKTRSTMARRERLEQSNPTRVRRYFSEGFRKDRVREIERGLSTVREVCKAHGVSDAAVYKWLDKYSNTRKKAVVQVVEAKSATRKVMQLKQQVQELHAAVGEKQMQVEFLEKLIELANEQYGIDLKKSTGTRPFSGSGPTVKPGKATAR